MGVSIATAMLLTGSAYAANVSKIVTTDKSTVQKEAQTAAKGAVEKLAPQYAEGEVIVQYKANVATSKVNSLAAANGLAVAKQYKMLSAQGKGTYIKVTGKQSTEELVAMLKADPNVESVSPNYIRRLDVVPNDTDFRQVWGLHNTGQTVNGISGTYDADIDAPQAWEVSTGSPDVVVAVFDTGVDYVHEDLTANMWVNTGEIAGNGIDDDANGYIDDVYGADVAVDLAGTLVDGDPMDIMGHGTHCAGTIGAVGDNGVGVAGVNWDVSIMAMKVFRPDLGAYDSDILDAIDYVLAQKANGENIVAVNASYGSYGGDQADPMNAAIQSLGDAGIVFCAAAGNDGIDNDVAPHFPSSYNASNIIAVAASDQDDQLATFSNFGATSVDLAAPGVNIRSTLPRTYVPQSSDIFFDDMESGSSKWVTTGTNNTWAISTDQEIFENPTFPVPSPTHFWSDSPGVNYVPNTDSVLTVADAIDLSGYVGQPVYFAFGAAAYIEGGGWDHGYVQVSGDAGATWTTIHDFGGYANYWGHYEFVIPDAYKTAQFKFRFNLTTDSSVQYDGWLIDDVGIGTTLTSSYANWDGTSMATPAVTGAVALLASAYPAETAAERQARLLSTVDTKTNLNGAVLTSGRMNVAAAIGGTVDSPTPPAPPASDDGGGLPVNDIYSLLFTIFGFLTIGGLIARRKLA